MTNPHIPALINLSQPLLTYKPRAGLHKKAGQVSPAPQTVKKGQHQLAFFDSLTAEISLCRLV